MPDSSMAEQPAVNRQVVGSNPTLAAIYPGIEQMVARWFHRSEVIGSSPIPGTKRVVAPLFKNSHGHPPARNSDIIRNVGFFV